MNQESGPKAVDEKNQIGWFAPLCLFLIIELGSYALKLCGDLAIVEDPSYRDKKKTDDENAQDGPSKPITSSLRKMFYTIYSVPGFMYGFRGFFYSKLILVAAWIVLKILSMPLGIVAENTKSPLPNTLLRHIARNVRILADTMSTQAGITRPKNGRFFTWSRMPPLMRTINALALPAFLHGMSQVLAQVCFGDLHNGTYGKLLLYFLAGSQTSDEYLRQHGDDAYYHLVAGVTMARVSHLAMTGLKSAVTYPSYVIMIRVQASLLPDEDEPIVPIDRSPSRQSAVGEVDNGLGRILRRFISISPTRRAWNGLPRGFWARIAKVQISVLLIVMIPVVYYFISQHSLGLV